MEVNEELGDVKSKGPGWYEEIPVGSEGPAVQVTSEKSALEFSRRTTVIVTTGETGGTEERTDGPLVGSEKRP